MRICMLAYTFYDCDNRVMRYAEALAERSDDVEVISLRRPDQERETILHGVKVRRIQKRVKNERKKRSYFFRLLLFFFRSMLVITLSHLRHPYRIIHVHSVPDFLVFAAWIPKLTGTRVILDIHDLSPELYAIKFSGHRNSAAYRLLCLIERLACGFADHVIVPNHLWVPTLAARSVSGSKCSVCLNLPDRNIFRYSDRPAPNSTRADFLYPGSLQWHQGLDIAIRAFAVIARELPGARFHIYGEGQAKASLMALTVELGLENRIRFHRFLPLRKIARVMRAATVGVIPKRSDSFGDEAFSTKILEFMALGVPVIVSATKVDRYYFNDDVAAFFRPGCVEDLSECMRRLIAYPTRRSAQAAAALELVDRRFNRSSKKMEYLALVDSLKSEAGNVVAPGVAKATWQESNRS